MSPSTRAPRPVAGLIALAGAFVAGSGLALLAAERVPSTSPDSEAPPTVAGDGAAATSDAPDLFADLDLTPEQQIAVDSILARTRTVVDSVFEASTEAFRVEAERARTEIVGVLDADQARAFAERVESAGPVRIRRVQVGDSVLREDTLSPAPVPEPSGR